MVCEEQPQPAQHGQSLTNQKLDLGTGPDEWHVVYTAVGSAEAQINCPPAGLFGFGERVLRVGQRWTPRNLQRPSARLAEEGPGLSPGCRSAGCSHGSPQAAATNLGRCHALSQFGHGRSRELLGEGVCSRARDTLEGGTFVHRQ